MESGQSAQRNSQNRSVKLACRSSNTAKHRERATKNMKETKKREGKWNGRVVPLAPSNIRIHKCAIVVVVWIHHCRTFLSACKTIVQRESDYDIESQKSLRLSKSILAPSVQRRQILGENDSFLSREQSMPVAAPSALKLDLYWVLNDTLCRNDSNARVFPRPSCTVRDQISNCRWNETKARDIGWGWIRGSSNQINGFDHFLFRFHFVPFYLAL